MRFYNDGGNGYINPARVNFITIDRNEGLFVVRFRFADSSFREIIYHSFADAEKEVNRFLNFCEPNEPGSGYAREWIK